MVCLLGGRWAAPQPCAAAINAQYQRARRLQGMLIEQAGMRLPRVDCDEQEAEACALVAGRGAVAAAAVVGHGDGDHATATLCTSSQLSWP